MSDLRNNSAMEAIKIAAIILNPFDISRPFKMSTDSPGAYFMRLENWDRRKEHYEADLEMVAKIVQKVALKLNLDEQ